MAERGLKVGAAAPDFTLPAGGGGELNLRKVLQQGPAVVVFYRLAFTGG